MNDIVKEKPEEKQVKVDPKEMYQAKQRKLTIELSVQRDLSRIKFHRFDRSVQWRDLTACEQMEILDALELAVKEAKANAKIDIEKSNWKELNAKMKV